MSLWEHNSITNWLIKSSQVDIQSWHIKQNTLTSDYFSENNVIQPHLFQNIDKECRLELHLISV